jgi:hypothetical protein
MKHGLMSVIGAILMTVGAEAFAIDQVTLSNGQVIEGTVLNDIPGRHVDLRLINGQTRRYQRAEVSGVERDVPSTSDRSVLGNESNAWFSVLGGGYLNLINPNSGLTAANSLLFDFGAKFGMNLSNLDFAWLAFALSYDYVADPNNSSTGFAVNSSRAYHDLNLQMLFTRVGQSGFYFGPTGGLALFPSNGSLAGTGSAANSYFEVGAVGGYDFFFSRSFSIGPDVRYQHIFTSDANILKFALQLGLHF